MSATEWSRTISWFVAVQVFVLASVAFVLMNTEMGSAPLHFAHHDGGLLTFCAQEHGDGLFIRVCLIGIHECFAVRLRFTLMVGY